ncbi:hypothetical protein, partial [Klebsiella quasipneumoniae]|uniref:hypothetical protein n=1 Tax=Klebsiella quasipneumoniae TaxID=1463165 RepID=UPI00272FDFB3
DRGLQGTPEGTVYSINNVTIGTERSFRPTLGAAPDTLIASGYTLLYQQRLAYKPSALLSAVFLPPQERFKQSNSDRTYRRLTRLRVFDRMEI